MRENVPLMGAVYTAHETLDVGPAANRLTKAVFGVRNHAFITCEGGDVRFWLDGGTPTSTSGHLMEGGDALFLDRIDQLDGFRCVSSGGARPKLQCSYGETR